MSIPTEGELFAKLIEHLRLAQEAAATLGHLASANDRRVAGRGWIAVSEGLKISQRTVTAIATGKLN